MAQLKQQISEVGILFVAHIVYKCQSATQLKIPVLIFAVLVVRFCRQHGLNLFYNRFVLF